MNDTSKRRTYKPRLSPKENLAKTEAEIVKARTRAEQKLIRAAEKAGYFRFKLNKDQLVDMFSTTIDSLKPPLSTFANLQSKKAGIAKQLRKEDGRRKALLGSFLVAQCRHKPDLHARIVDDIRAFLSDHPNTTVAERNLTLLEGFLADPDTQDVKPEQDKPPLPSSEYRVTRAHRLILLGTWVLDRTTTRADIALLISEELTGFLDQGANPDRSKDLLSDLLGWDEPEQHEN